MASAETARAGRLRRAAPIHRGRRQRLTLTQGGVGNTSTALWYDTPLPLAGSPWTATFTYLNSSGRADGTAFVMQKPQRHGRPGPTPGGGNLGFSGIPTSAGMTLQIYKSSEINFVTDPPGSLENIGNNHELVNLRATNTPTNFYRAI